MEELELRVQRKAQEAKALVVRMNSLYQSLPSKSRGRLKGEIEEKIKTISFYRVPLQGDIWQVRLCLEHQLLKSPFWKIVVDVQYEGRIVTSVWWDITETTSLHLDRRASLCRAIANTPNWPSLLNFVDSALEQAGEVFDDAFRQELQRLDPDIVDLSRQLRNAAEHETSLILTIKQTIPKLQKVAQNLQDTKGFISHSKTIKNIRESVEMVVRDLEKA